MITTYRVKESSVFEASSLSQRVHGPKKISMVLKKQAKSSRATAQSIPGSSASNRPIQPVFSYGTAALHRST